jgi:type IV secretory pathway component VirB8
MTAFEWVAAILSVTLAVFLVLSIFLLVQIIRFVKQLKRITTKAEKVADSVSSTRSFFKGASGGIAIWQYISNIVESVSVRRRKTKH